MKTLGQAVVVAVLAVLRVPQVLLKAAESRLQKHFDRSIEEHSRPEKDRHRGYYMFFR